MKNFFSKHWFFTAVACFVIIVFTSVLILIFKEFNSVATLVFNFLNDWAIPLSASVTLLLAIAAFWNIRESRISRIQESRRLALERMRFWAEDSIAVLTKPLPRKQFQSVCAGLVLDLHPIHTKCLGILADAEQLGSDLHEEVSAIFLSLSKFLIRLKTEEELPDKLKELYTDAELEYEVKPFSNVKELVSGRREAIEQLSSLIYSTTSLLVISQ